MQIGRKTGAGYIARGIKITNILAAVNINCNGQVLA
jgi:hypothetical protein